MSVRIVVAIFRTTFAALVAAVACGGRIDTLTEVPSNASAGQPLDASPRHDARSGNTPTRPQPPTGDGGRQLLDVAVGSAPLTVPPGNEYGGPGTSRCNTGSSSPSPTDPPAPCAVFYNCYRSCYTDADCPSGGSGSATPICPYGTPGGSLGFCMLECDETHLCPDGMRCQRGEVGYSCYWPNTAALPGCCGGAGYGCGGFYGTNCCPGLVCKGDFCVPPDWSPPPGPFPADCGGTEWTPCDTVATSIDAPPSSCRFEIPHQAADAGPSALNGVGLLPVTNVLGALSRAPPGHSEIALRHVSSLLDCAAQGGWYFEDETAPKFAILCPSTCECINRVANTVEVVVGCPRIDAPDGDAGRDR